MGWWGMVVEGLIHKTGAIKTHTPRKGGKKNGQKMAGKMDKKWLLVSQNAVFEIWTLNELLFRV